MPRESKRQKITHTSDTEKDDEEKRLENALFGTGYEFGLEEDEYEGNEMGNLRDDELFVIDGDEDVKGKKRSAWVDPEDIEVSLEAPRLRKLRDSASETHLSSHEYERRLRRQFEQTFPAPAWAKQTTEDDAEDLAIKKSEGTLSVSRLRDPLIKDKAGAIKSLAWHPGKDMPLLAVGSTDRRVRLFNVDGHTSPLVLTLHVPSIPITSQTGLTWHPGGKHLLITGSRPFYHIYDVQEGRMKTVGGKGASLWGTRFSAGAKRTHSNSSESLENVSFSPDGKLLAIAGKGGIIHLLDFSSPGQVISSLKLSGGGVSPQGMFWSSSDELIALSTNGEVHVFDVGEQRCVRKWKDEGAWTGSVRGLAGFTSSDGRGLLTTGSSSGLVNVYPFTSSSSPSPIKTLTHLTTPITSLTFNHDGRLFLTTSEGKDHLKLYRTESLTPLTYWPTSNTPLGNVTCVGFSSQSEFMAVGNARGRVGLWRLEQK